RLRELLDAQDGAGAFDKLKAEGLAMQQAQSGLTALPSAAAAAFAPRALEIRKGALRLMTDEALKRLKEHGEVYQRGGQAVCVKRVLVPTTAGDRVLPRIVPMKTSTMLDALSAAARWGVTRHDKQTGQSVFADCDPPENVARVIVD